MILADSAVAVGSKKDVCPMSLHTFPAPKTTTEEVKTCTTILLDETTCTSEAERCDNGEYQVCRQCGEPICKRHSHNEATSWAGYGADRHIVTYGSLFVCTTCNVGNDITAIVGRLKSAAEDAYEGKSGKAVRELDDLVDDLIDVMSGLREATMLNP
jgi:hypothetical protein